MLPRGTGRKVLNSHATVGGQAVQDEVLKKNKTNNRQNDVINSHATVGGKRGKMMRKPPRVSRLLPLMPACPCLKSLKSLKML